MTADLGQHAVCMRIFCRWMSAAIDEPGNVGGSGHESVSHMTSLVRGEGSGLRVRAEGEG